MHIVWVGRSAVGLGGAVDSGWEVSVTGRVRVAESSVGQEGWFEEEEGQGKGTSSPFCYFLYLILFTTVECLHDYLTSWAAEKTLLRESW